MSLPVLKGVVVKGDGLGRQLGFPTANIKVESGAPPERGVYRVTVSAPGFSKRPGACNVGVRPTVKGQGQLHVEVHLPGFEGDLYGQTLELAFVERLRGEIKFPSLDALRVQIAEDVARVVKASSGS